jgi:hypothetical protein
MKTRQEFRHESISSWVAAGHDKENPDQTQMGQVVDHGLEMFARGIEAAIAAVSTYHARPHPLRQYLEKLRDESRAAKRPTEPT